MLKRTWRGEEAVAELVSPSQSCGTDGSSRPGLSLATWANSERSDNFSGFSQLAKIETSVITCDLMGSELTE